MKVLIIQSAGLHNGNDGFCRNDYLRECFAFRHAFEELGHEATVWGLRHENFAEKPKDEYDLVLLAEQYEFSDWIPNLLDFKKAIKCQWIVDLHYQGAEKYAKYTNYTDVVLHATRKLIGQYKSQFPETIKHFWFPNAVDSRYFHGQGLKYNFKTEELVFVGSDHASRREYIDGLKRDLGLKSFFLTGNDMLNKISSAKIHFNKNISCDINYRTFETIGLGVVLATNYDDDLFDLGFEPGKNCILYNHYQDCVEQLRTALLEGQLEEVAKEAFELSKKNTYTERVRTLLECL